MSHKKKLWGDTGTSIPSLHILGDPTHDIDANGNITLVNMSAGPSADLVGERIAWAVGSIYHLAIRQVARYRMFRIQMTYTVPSGTLNPSTSYHIIPFEFKQAIVTPRLKKSGLGASDLKNYRPVSNLSFLSKL